MSHGITSARYAEPIPAGEDVQPADAPVVVTLETGQVQQRQANDDIDDGGMRAYLREGGEIAPYQTPAPTGRQINVERERRIEAGTDITLSDGTVVALQGRPEDMTNLLGRYTAAQAMIEAGDPTPMAFRDRNNVIHGLSPELVVELHMAGQAWVERVYQASWSLKDGGEIPADYAADGHWPT